MDAVILAGGKGTRLGDSLPKALVEVQGRSLISRQIDYLKDKVDRISLSLGYRGELVEDYVRQQNYWAKDKIYFAKESSPLGTAGGLKNAIKDMDVRHVVVLNCDDITDISISRLERMTENTICTANPTLPFGLVNEKNGYAVFVEKPKMDGIWVNCGWYRLDISSIYDKLPDKGDLERKVFPQINLRRYKHNGFWATVNSKKEMEEFEKLTLPDCLK